MPTNKWLPAYVRARARLGIGRCARLDEQLLRWTIGLVKAEDEGTAAEYVGTVGRPGWIEFDDLKVLMRVRLDDRGHAKSFEFFNVRER